MAGYIGSKAVNLSTTGADINGNANVDGTLDVTGATTVTGAFTSLGIDDNAAATAVTIDASGNVGIGTSSPDELLEVSANTGAAIKITSTDTVLATGEIIGSIKFESNDSSGIPPHTSAQIDVIAEDDFGRGAMVFSTGRNFDFQEAMRIDSSGNVLVGTTNTTNYNNNAGTTADNGLVVLDTGILSVSSYKANANVGFVQYLNRTNTDGGILELRKNGISVGSIGYNGANPYMVSANGAGFAAAGPNSAIVPTDGSGNQIDNSKDIGAVIVRFDDVYATNGTIQTSDRNEKEAIASLTPTEMLVAARLSTSFKNFKWKDSVADKGLEAARMHSGIIAQDVQDAFAAEGLDASDYAMFISGTWWEAQTDVPAVEAVAEVVDEEGNVVTEAVEAKDAYTRTDTYETLEEAPEGATERTRLGVRYPELLAFVAAYNDQRFLTIEARLTALEATP